ncbi:MAG: hypothetical protein Q4B34_00790 [Candidatus Saccharibacteria bacterium]|nr:hypothetical protein [Candidatus Saccharibacteria bacterium]
MIKVFYGEDRVRAKQAIEKFLGENYEIIDCENLSQTDLPSIFHGATFFSTDRKILLRDFFVNKDILEKLPEYLDTKHDVALFESKLDKRSSVYKELKDKIEFLEFKPTESRDFNLVFGIYRTAKTNGKKAVADLKKIEQTEDPMMFFGLLVSSALKDFAARQGIKEKRALEELSKTDSLMKSTSIQPWLLIESFLLRLSSLQ